jgi:Mg2+/citrate symporter
MSLRVWVAIVAAAVVTIVVWAGPLTPSVRFAPFTLAAFSSSLVPLLVIAVLIERTVEVLFGITREPRQRQLERKNDNVDRAARLRTRNASEAEVRAYLAAAAAVPVDETTVAAAGVARASLAFDSTSAVPSSLMVQKAVADAALSRFEADSTFVAFCVSLALGVLAALAGVRVLDLLLAAPETAAEAGPVGQLFQVLNVMLTAGLLAGGADGFHHLTAVIQEFLRSLKDQAERQGQANP